MGETPSMSTVPLGGGAGAESTAASSGMVSTAETAAAASATFFAAREEGGRELEEGALEREEGGLTPEAEVVVRDELGAGMDGKRGRQCGVAENNWGECGPTFPGWHDG
jgi:hypothetical protein